MAGRHDPGPIPAPWVLVDDHTVQAATALLDRLSNWLYRPDNAANKSCARALSLGETDDPVTLASWADTLAARLRHLAQESSLDPSRLTD